MPTLDELDVLCTYLEDQEMYQDCIYRSPSTKFVPKSMRSSPCIWIVRDGKAVDFNKKKKKGEQL